MLWAHNGHARKTPYVDDKTVIATMGSRLHELFGRQQMVVGFAFNQGSFQAIQGGVGLIDHTVPPAPEGSLDRVLAAADMPAYLLNLATAPATGAVADWLTSQPLSRSIGAVYSAEDAERFLEACDPRRALRRARVRGNHHGRASQRGRPAHTLARPPTGIGRNQPGACRQRRRSGRMGLVGRSTVHAHRLVLSDEPSPSGGRSLRIARRSAPWRWGQGRLEQTFSAEAWRGKRLRFSAAMCAEAEGPGTAAHLYIEVRPKQPKDMPWTMPASALAMTEPPVRCAHWKTYAVELRIAEDAQTIVIGLALAGTGAAWFADLKSLRGGPLNHRSPS